MMNTPEQTTAQGTLVNQTPAPNPTDPHQTGSGSSSAPGGGDASHHDMHNMTQGQESYPGFRPAGEEGIPGTPPPEAGDVDSGSTESAEATGQDGNLNDPGKKTGLPWK